MDKSELLQCINDLEAIAAKRQQKVLQLEAQLREAVYSGKKKGNRVADAPHEADEQSDGDADDTLMEDLLVMLPTVSVLLLLHACPILTQRTRTFPPCD